MQSYNVDFFIGYFVTLPLRFTFSSLFECYKARLLNLFTVEYNWTAHYEQQDQRSTLILGIVLTLK